MLRCGSSREDVTSRRKVREVKACRAPLPGTATFDAMRLIQDHVTRPLLNPCGNLFIPACQTLVVDEQHFAVARDVTVQPRDTRLRIHPPRRLIGPRVERRERRNDEQPFHASFNALGFITGISYGGFTSTRHGKVRAVGQRQNPIEIAPLKPLQLSQIKATHKVARKRIQRRSDEAAGEKSGDLPTLGMFTFQQCADGGGEVDVAVISHQRIAEPVLRGQKILDRHEQLRGLQFRAQRRDIASQLRPQFLRHAAVACDTYLRRASAERNRQRHDGYFSKIPAFTSVVSASRYFLRSCLNAWPTLLRRLLSNSSSSITTRSASNAFARSLLAFLMLSAGASSLFSAL